MASSEGDCLIRDVKLRSGHHGPVLVNFEHGRLKGEDAAALNCSVFAPEKSSGMCTVGVVATDGDVVYQGDVRKDERDLCHTFLAIRNKRTNKMRIYEASNVTLSPNIGSNFNTSFDLKEYSEALYTLNHTFGSKKNKRIADQRKRMEGNVDNVKAKLSATVQKIKLKGEPLTPTGEDDTVSKLLPQCNRDATDPADVYPISGLLRDDEIRQLEHYYSKATKAGTFDTEYKKSPFFKQMEKKIEPGNVRSMALLLYADSLLSTCNLNAECIKRKDKGPCPYSERIHRKILKEFTVLDGNARVIRPASMVDKAIAHIIILGLLVGGFKFDLDSIIESVRRVDVQRIKMIASVLGAVPTSSKTGGKNVVALRVPLPAQKSLMVKGRRSRR